MKAIVSLVVLCFVLMDPPDAPARVWEVDVNGMPGVDCDCVTIQACIDSASAGDTVEVACGTYYEYDIEMKSGINLRSETGLPDCVTIDAAQQGRVVYCADVDSTTRIEGFRMTGGLLSGTDSGAGICCEHSSPRIYQCEFSGNSAPGGAGLSCYDGSAPLLVDAAFTDNANAGMGCDNSSPTLIRVSFARNAAGYGGGFACWDCTASLTDCAFSSNTSPGGYGGGVYTWDSALTLTRVRFEGNTAPFGGALYSEIDSPLELSHCTFWSNSATNLGGAMACVYGGPAIVSNCTFYGNSAGAWGSVIDCAFDYELTLDNSILAFNTGCTQAVTCSYRSGVTASCCNVYGNDGPDWDDCLQGQLGIRGNISECPRFCDAENGDFHLQECSPCAPGNHPTGYPCGLIGAYEVGCPCGEPSAVEETSWSSLKAMYR